MEAACALVSSTPEKDEQRSGERAGDGADGVEGLCEA